LCRTAGRAKARRRLAWDCLAWAVLHVAASYLPRLLPDTVFRLGSWPWAIRDFESGGRRYDALWIRSWQHRLPDGRRLLGGGAPPAPTSDPDRLADLAARTCRNELAHWLAIAGAPGFALFNPPGATVAIHVYALATNLPCIAVQRYNRARLVRALSRARGRPHPSPVMNPVYQASGGGTPASTP